MTEKTMEEKVAAVLSSKAPATLKTLAAATGLTELEASKLLPADSRAYADGSKFDESGARPAPGPPPRSSLSISET